MPAAVLVLFVLAAITVDGSVVFMQQRALVEAAQAAANDAAGYGLDVDAFYRGDRVQFDLARAREAAVASVAAKGIDAVPAVHVDPARTHVFVVLHLRVRAVFTPTALDGGATTVSARASAALPDR